MDLPIAQTNQSRDVLDSINVLLRDLIDYAGLFPPASLSMASSVANYDAYTRSRWSWILGHFVVPVARLSEFEEALVALPPSEPGQGPAKWRLSAILGADPVANVAGIREFNARMATSRSNRRAAVESVEVKVASSAEITQLSGIIPAECIGYFEFPLPNGAECIAALSQCGRRAKIRTGGETADKFPAPESVIEFVRLCALSRVPFKATAGLHHPLRSVHRMTYQADSPFGIMHGFLNVFLAAAFLRAGMDAEVAVKLLEEQSADSIHFDSDEISWRQHRLSREQISAARQGFSVSFGSCSFTEPIDDLRSLGLL
jgi:hypothetical protein